MNFHAIAGRIKARTQALGLTQKAASEKAGISEAMYSRICKEEVQTFGIDVLEGICKALDVSADYILGYGQFTEEFGEEAVQAAAFTGLPVEAVLTLHQRLTIQNAGGDNYLQEFFDNPGLFTRLNQSLMTLAEYASKTHKHAESLSEREILMLCRGEIWSLQHNLGEKCEKFMESYYLQPVRKHKPKKKGETDDGIL